MVVQGDVSAYRALEVRYLTCIHMIVYAPPKFPAGFTYISPAGALEEVNDPWRFTAYVMFSAASNIVG